MTEQPDIKQTAVAQAGPSLAQIAGRVLNRPLLLHPDKADLILHVLQGRIGIEPLQTVTPETNRFVGTYRRDNGGVGSMRVENGVAILPIVGSLVNRGAWIGASSGLVSYEGIAAQLREAETDPDVRAILLDIDSPGGEATGMFAAAKLVSAVNKTKPVVAFVNDVAASAAYGIASAASEIIVSPTSMVGSIGVITEGFGYDSIMERVGVERRVLQAGKFKALLDPYAPANGGVTEHWQAMLDEVHEQFITAVKEGRGDRLNLDLEPDLFEGLIFTGHRSVELGIADDLGSLNDISREEVGGINIVDYTPTPDLLKSITGQASATLSAMFATMTTPSLR